MQNRVGEECINCSPPGLLMAGLSSDGLRSPEGANSGGIWPSCTHGSGGALLDISSKKWQGQLCRKTN